MDLWFYYKTVTIIFVFLNYFMCAFIHTVSYVSVRSTYVLFVQLSVLSLQSCHSVDCFYVSMLLLAWTHKQINDWLTIWCWQNISSADLDPIMYALLADDRYVEDKRFCEQLLFSLNVGIADEDIRRVFVWADEIPMSRALVQSWFSWAATLPKIW